jgi:CxxC-x17-CxxC domain-containing protein
VPDQELVCRDCGAAFAFTEAEQEFFHAQGFAHPPKRCKACRAKARHRGSPPPRERAPRVGEAPERSATADPAGGTATATTSAPAVPRAARPRGPMHPATCSLCSTSTEVPFVPDGVRPVFCLPCLKKQTR